MQYYLESIWLAIASFFQLDNDAKHAANAVRIEKTQWNTIFYGLVFPEAGPQRYWSSVGSFW